MCIVTFEIRILCKKPSFLSNESKKLANSQPGDGTSVFQKTVSSSPGTKLPKVLMERHGQPLMESIRFVVTLEVKVLRVKNGLESKV
jgi:hypothetical protein